MLRMIWPSPSSSPPASSRRRPGASSTRSRPLVRCSTSARRPRGENNYGLLRVLPDRVERYILGSRYGLRSAGYINTQSNEVHH